MPERNTIMIPTTQPPSPPPPTPTPQTILFARGVLARLSVWSTLRIAIQEGWGGPSGKEKRTWIASTIVDSFEQDPEQPDETYIEQMLLQIMSDEFDAMLEDDSAAGVAQDIVMMWLETREGKWNTVKKYEELVEKIRGKRIEAREALNSDSDDDISDSDDDVEEGLMDVEDEVPRLIQHPPVQPIVDEAGFTLVGGKGKGRHR